MLQMYSLTNAENNSLWHSVSKSTLLSARCLAWTLAACKFHNFFRLDSCSSLGDGSTSCHNKQYLKFPYFQEPETYCLKAIVTTGFHANFTPCRHFKKVYRRCQCQFQKLYNRSNDAGRLLRYVNAVSFPRVRNSGLLQKHSSLLFVHHLSSMVWKG